MDNKQNTDDLYYGDASIPQELLNLDDPEKLIREGDDTPDTPKKRRQNYINKNKQFLFGGVALMLVLGVFLYTAFLQRGPDYIVGLMTAYTMPEPGRQQLEGLLTSWADDRNGDGQVSVKLQTYVFVPNSSDEDQREEALMDLQVSLISKECMIFLHDDLALEEVQDQMEGVLDESVTASWNDCKALTSFVPDETRLNMWDPEIYLGLCESLKVSLCAPDETIRADEEMSAYYEASAAFVQRLVAGEKPQ